MIERLAGDSLMTLPGTVNLRLHSAVELLMYFTCSTMQSTMLVASCSKNRDRKRPPCNDCDRWKIETTDEQNLKTKEEVEAGWLSAEPAPEPQRFDRSADFKRMLYFGKRG